MKRMMGLLAVILTMLAGCDQVRHVMAEQQQPNVMLGAGAQVQIDESQTAKVFGPENLKLGSRMTIPTMTCPDVLC